MPRIDFAKAIVDRRGFVERMRSRGLARGRLSAEQRRRLTTKPPTAATVAYSRELLAIVRTIFREARAGVMAELSDTLRSDADGAATRTDAKPQRLATSVAFEQLKLRVAEIAKSKSTELALRGVAAQIQRHSANEVSRIFLINLRDPGLGLGDFIDRFVRRNVDLVTEMSSSAIDRLERIVNESTAGQLRVEELAARVERALDVSESRAILIARDQTLTANAEISRLRQQQLGVTHYVWSTSNDGRVRGSADAPPSDQDHASLDGQTFTWSDPPITNPVTGARAHPGEDIQCRCVAIPVIDSIGTN